MKLFITILLILSLLTTIVLIIAIKIKNILLQEDSMIILFILLAILYFIH